MGLIGVLLALAAAQDPVFPSRPGVTWTWGGGEQRLSAETWERLELRGRPCVRLRFWRLETAKPWNYGDLYLAERDGTLSLLGYRVGDLDYLAQAPPELLPKTPVEGQAWKGKFEAGSMDKGDYRWQDFDFRVEGQGQVRIPTGMVDAWKIRWTSDDDPDGGDRLWIAPGTGIVRIDSLSKKFNRVPWTLELRSVDLQRPDRFNRIPELDAAKRQEGLRLLSSLDDAAAKAIRDLGPGTLPLLRERMAAETDAAVRDRLEAIVSSFARLRIQARASRPVAHVGEPLPVEFFLVNDGPEPVYVLPCIQDSAMNLERKFPAITATITGPNGKDLTGPIFGSFWGAPHLQGRQFRRLLPGEGLDPFDVGDGSMPAALGYKTVEKGKHVVRLVYDLSGAGDADWTTKDGPPDEEAFRYLRSMPRGRFTAEPLTVMVTEKK